MLRLGGRRGRLRLTQLRAGHADALLGQRLLPQHALGEGDGALYRGTLRRSGTPPNLNALGWKVAHLQPVGLRTSAALTEVPIEMLQEHLRRLLSPRNMNVVPMSHGGLAELPEFLEAFAR